MRLRSPLWGYVIFIVVVFILAILIPVSKKSKAVVHQVVCETNLKVMMTSLAVYMNDYDQKFPTAKQWCDLLIEKGAVPPGSFRCPESSDTEFAYAINKSLYEIEPGKVPSQMVVLFEANLGRNGVGGLNDVVFRHEQNGKLGCNITFVDGHTEFVTEDRIAELKWTVE